MCHEMERDSFIKKHLNFPAILYVPPFGFYQCENCQVGEKTFSLEIQITLIPRPAECLIGWKKQIVK